ncbi:MAG TPA: hypothetical protein VHN11_04415 [Xanthobacteraceae bacterium]|jgi:hypothetical protein|nr:hypothetical protein [Xanthobacteraceae bacterium]
MALSADDHRQLLRGFEAAGLVRLQDSTSTSNPIKVAWSDGPQIRRFRLWLYDITHGGGGADVRAANEYRIQITNGPSKTSDFDAGGYTDVLLGYSRQADVIVAYDRRWLQRWTENFEANDVRGSPSVQVKNEDIDRGRANGLYHLVKTATFGEADIITIRPDLLPAYLSNIPKVMSGEMNAQQAAKALNPMEDIVAFCAERGFSFQADLIARYLAAFLAKPFVILAGVSGTGKSKLAELVAEFYSRGPARQEALLSPRHDRPAAAPQSGDEYIFSRDWNAVDPTRFALVAVRPDWIDNQSILGFVNPVTQTYESTQALDLLLRADAAQKRSDEVGRRFFLLLDEMNLARVEHYFSDWLACSESRRVSSNGSVSQQAIALHRGTGLTTQIPDSLGAEQQYDVPANMNLPLNLVVTGTINVDETTYGLSPKVLDRAMVLEFDEVDLGRLTGHQGDHAKHSHRLPEALPAFQLPQPSDFAGLPSETQTHLKVVNAILQQARLHFGYRAATEMARFMTIYVDFLPIQEPVFAWETALDAALLQKVLPRLQGNRAKLERTLVNLCLYLRDLAIPAAAPESTEFDDISSAALPGSYRRAVDMLRSLRDFGFVSFFK